MEYLSALRKRWLVITLLAVLGAGAGFGLAKTTVPTYRASTTTFVSLARGETVNELVQGTMYTQNLVESFARLATMPTVLDPVIEELDLNMSARSLARTITATTPLDTMFVEISATSRDPELAANVADAVTTSLASTVETIAPSGAEDTPSVTMTVVADAVVPTVPFTPNTKMNVALGGAGGLAVGVALALLLTVLDTRVRGIKDVPSHQDRVLLGIVPRERSRRDQVTILGEPHGAGAESYRRIQTNLQFIGAASQLRTLVVSSSVSGEGKSTVALNVAVALAEKGGRVLLVDADLRRPTIATVTGLEPSVGLTTVLVGSAKLEDVTQPWGHPGLDVVVSGDIPPNPAQLIDSAGMQALIDEAAQQYDHVVLDAPPILPVADGVVLARRTDGVVMVVGSARVRRTQVSSALTALDTVGARCLGVVVNFADPSHADTPRGYVASEPSGLAAAARRQRARRTAPTPEDTAASTASHRGPRTTKTG